MNKLDPKKVDIVQNWLQDGSINFFGMQFSGKDTQADRFAKLFGGVVLGGGDILRNSKVPKSVQNALDEGSLIPTKDYIDIVLPYLSKPEFSKKPLLLSAVGRWIGEEQNVLAATKAAGHEIKVVVFLRLREETAFARLASARRERDDDYQQNLERRLAEFHNKTLPVLQVYEDLGMLVEVDGEKTPDEVTSDILDLLYKKAIA